MVTVSPGDRELVPHRGRHRSSAVVGEAGAWTTVTEMPGVPETCDDGADSV
jgi:hypothetical protein